MKKNYKNAFIVSVEIQTVGTASLVPAFLRFTEKMNKQQAMAAGNSATTIEKCGF